VNTAGATSTVLVVVCAAALRLAWASGPRARTARRLALSAPTMRRSLVVPIGLPRRIAAAMAACALPVDPATAWLAWLVGVTLGVVVGLALAGIGGVLVVIAVAGAGPVVAWRLLRHRQDQLADAALPEVVDAVARGLRSGGSLRQALEEAAACAPPVLAEDLAAVVRATERGVALVDALEEWAQRRPLPGVRLAAAALCLGAETGGAQARAVDGVAATLRMRLATRAEANALATQARASAALIAAAPLAFCMLASATDPRTAGFLFRTPLGLAMLGTGLALDAAGALWMARLTRIEP